MSAMRRYKAFHAYAHPHTRTVDKLPVPAPRGPVQRLVMPTFFSSLPLTACAVACAPTLMRSVGLFSS